MFIPCLDSSHVNGEYCKNRAGFLENMDHIVRSIKKNPLTAKISDVAGKKISREEVYGLLEQARRHAWLVETVDLARVQTVVEKFQLAEEHPDLKEWLDDLFVKVKTPKYQAIVKAIRVYNEKAKEAAKTTQVAVPQFKPVESKAALPLPAYPKKGKLGSFLFSTACKVGKLALCAGIGYVAYNRDISSPLASLGTAVGSLIEWGQTPVDLSRSNNLNLPNAELFTHTRSDISPITQADQSSIFAYLPESVSLFFSQAATVEEATEEPSQHGNSGGCEAMMRVLGAIKLLSHAL